VIGWFNMGVFPVVITQISKRLVVVGKEEYALDAHKFEDMVARSFILPVD
jgi:hypothetical protein